MANKELSLRQQLDALAAQGKEIKVTWEGGNDSGGYSLFIDGVEVNYGDEAYDEIVDPISDNVDYGSWAGDFSADGSVVYDSEQGGFIGEGRDTESQTCELDDIDIEIRVPKALNFDSIEIVSEGTYFLEELSVRCGFVMANGPVFPEHLETQYVMETYVRDSIDDILTTHKECKDEEIGWVYNEWTLRRESLGEDGDYLVGNINSIDFSLNNTINKSYYIPINED